MNAFNYLKKYSNFESVHEMDQHVKQHVETVFHDITSSTRKVIFAIAGHALASVGAAHLKAETIAQEISSSVKTVHRAIKTLTEKGIIAKVNKPKMNGIKGANIYSILPFVPSTMSHREEAETPCETKAERPKIENESLIFLSNLKSLKDTNTTAVNASKKLMDGLLSKLPKIIAQTLEPFFDNADDVYTMAGTIFRAKAKVDKSVRIEDHESLFYKAIVSVFSSLKRGKIDNVFAVMYKAIMELTQKIVDGIAYDAPKSTAAPAVKKFEQAPDWMQVNHAAFAQSELVPDWMAHRNKQAPAPVTPEKDVQPIDFEAERRKILEKLNAL